MGKGGDLGRSSGEILKRNELNHAAVKLATENSNSKIADATTNDRPWYIRGGMHVNDIGMGLSIITPPVLLAATATATSLHTSFTVAHIFATVFFLQVIQALAVGMRTVVCVLAVPCYLTSLIVLPGTLTTRIAPTLALAVGIAVWRVGICMSVCLHRYAAHAAFKCGPATRLFLNILGCAANQGGPIWWASIHRCHHKYCDTPRDPHSAIQDGVENAFAFSTTGHAKVEEEFAPKHNDTWFLRLLDTWSFTVCVAEMCAAHYFFGREGLFVSYTSMWISQTTTLWFNIANHPPAAYPDKVCQATNYSRRPTGYYPAFWLFDALYSVFSVLTSEGAHEDHHVHFNLAKRDWFDCAYHSFILPLEKMGLVWDVKVVPAD